MKNKIDLSAIVPYIENISFIRKQTYIFNGKSISNEAKVIKLRVGISYIEEKLYS